MPSAAVPELWQFDRHAILSGEIWRLWTCHLVHYSARHALMDFATALAAGAIALPALGWRRLCLIVALSAPLISAGLLLLAPDLLYYRGASGMAVMLVVLAAGTLWPRAGRRARAALVLLGVALSVKIAAEALGYVASWSGLPPGVAVAWQAHLLGAVLAAFTVQSLTD
ncbi:rhomboid family GlyGly-CTERM serine protease [Duganella sp. 1224]|uniref:rhombosortase n=1 Tax=Duganella sp. 1224 TaxID=2587052 RepID=UPI0015C75A75|nr:rhombosortase [Duganella sp. 1224]NYE59556.1 rhomboid family GlyGly-CTERM serine protease [Duganella sp. 1224]